MLKIIAKQYNKSHSLLTHTPLANFSIYYGKLQEFKLSEQDLKPETPLQQFVNKYRKYGHHYAKWDPLGLYQAPGEFPSVLDWGVKYDDSIEEVHDSHLKEFDAVENLEKFLAKAYTGPVGVEFDHLTNLEEKQWLYEQYEQLMSKDLSVTEKSNILTLITMSETFDHFLQKKFETFKRYSGEGAETLMVALKTIFAKSSEKGVKEIVLGMPHRGRFNVLVGLLDYPARELFYKISGKNDLPEDLYTAIDDVPSHIAVSNKKLFTTGSGKGEQEISVSMLHNPSHLEAVNPVSMGKTRAKQDDFNDPQGDKVFNVQVHGDAAFSAQGVVYESFAISKTPHFNTGGTIHVICNNQIGFTTTPRDGRSSKYASDIAKPYDVPILHVNADSPDEVAKIAKLAVEYRTKFKKDILIDLIGYRRYGHNEVDEPEFTQPKMYEQVKKKQVSSPKQYHETLVSSNASKPDELTKLKEKFNKHLESEYQARNDVKKTLNTITSPEYKGNRAFTGKWKTLTFSQYGVDMPTGIDVEHLKKLGHASIFLPPKFTPHPRLQKYHIQARAQQFEKNSLDWATAEALAFASLIDQGVNIRFTGQDVERGTFSHRHLVLTDVKTEQKWCPLKEYSEGFNPKGRFHLHNSALSEAGVIGYEYGYSLENPLNLSIWEAQFGDFFNPGQVVFDTFITCSEAKWLRQTGMMILLPHGMDGTGPEHSSCRIERWLQMGSTDGIDRNLKLKEHDPKRKESTVVDTDFYANHQDINFQFINPTTPANYFHAIRRQMMRNYRKPIIVAAPKLLIRLPAARSKFEDMSKETAFKPVYVHGGELSSKINTVFACTGKVVYEILSLLKENPELQAKSAVFAVEELLPFPEKLIKDQLAKCSKDTKVIWVQEEHINNGAWGYVEPHLARIIDEIGFKNKNVLCHGRRSTASTATGVVEKHSKEHKQLISTLIKYK